MKIPFAHRNITHTAVTTQTEKQKAVKVIRKQLLIGAAAITAIATATVIVNKVLDVPAED